EERSLAEAKAATEARANLAVARRAIDRVITRFAQVHLDGVPHMERLRYDLYRDALAFNQELLASRADDPQSRLEVALAKGRLGQIHNWLGDHEQAEPLLRQAIDQLRQADPGARPLNLDTRLALVDFHLNLGMVEYAARKTNDAESLLRRGLMLAEA